MKIIIDDLTSKPIADLLTEHLEEMHQHSPAESVHALDLAKLKKPGITFWSIWDDESSQTEELLGCGALQQIDSHHAEVKSMRVTYCHQGKGLANRILEHLIEEAEKSGYQRLSLETGSMQAFDRARHLYQKYGFEYCQPFADYSEDPNSVFMTKVL